VDPIDFVGPCVQELHFWPLLEIETYFFGHPFLISSTLLWFLIVMCSLRKQDVTIECTRNGSELCRDSTVIVAALLFRVAITN